MKDFNSLVFLSLILCSACICVGKDSKKKSAAKICLDSYGKLAFHNLKHIEVQRKFYEIFIDGQKLENIIIGTEEYKELENKIKRAMSYLSEDPKVNKYLENMRAYCNQDDSHLLEELNIEQAEAFGKKEEADAEHDIPAYAKHQKEAKIDKFKQFASKAKDSISFEMSFTTSPTLILLPYCLLPTTIAFVSSLAESICRIKQEEKEDTRGAILDVPRYSKTGILCLAPFLKLQLHRDMA